MTAWNANDEIVSIDTLAALELFHRDYFLEQYITSGSYGKIYRARRFTTTTNDAADIKIAFLPTSRKARESLDNEITALRAIRNGNVVQVFDVFTTYDRLFMAMLYAQNGDVEDATKAVYPSWLEETNCRLWFRQISSALQHMHQGNALLTDFGFAIQAWDSITNSVPMCTTRCGVDYYISPPEMLDGNQYDPYSADVWSMGVFLYEMFVNKVPFRAENLQIKIAKQRNESYKKDLVEKTAAKELIDLFAGLFEVDPTKRLKISAVLQHNWTAQP